MSGLGLLTNVAGQIIGGAIGMGIDRQQTDYRQEQQLEQERELTELQKKANLELMHESAKVNEGLAISNWERNSPAMNAKRLREAGLNVGLMYSGGGGSGGATVQAPGTPSVGKGNANEPSQLGLQLGMQMAMQAAQIENIKADTEKKKTEAENIGSEGIDTKLKEANLANIAADTSNKEEQNAILSLEKEIKNVQANAEMMNWDEAVEAVTAKYKVAVEELKQAQTKTKVDQETAEARINQVKDAVIKQLAEIAAIKDGKEFNFGTDAEKVRWINAAMGAMKTISGVGGAIH